MAFEAPRCPNCYEPIGFWRVWRLRGRTGIKCAKCGALLRPRRFLRAVVTLLALFGGVLIILQLGELTFPQYLVAGAWLFFVSVSLGVYVASFEIAPRGEKITTDRITEEQEQTKAELQAVARSEEAYAEAHPKWRCKDCGEENPGEFESCWRCGHVAQRNAI